MAKAMIGLEDVDGEVDIKVNIEPDFDEESGAHNYLMQMLRVLEPSALEMKSVK